METRLTICSRCGSDACFAEPINEINYSYICWTCGFYSSDLIKVGEYEVDAFEANMPLLYRDLKFIDSKQRVWYPSVINNINKGTVFIQGKTKDLWEWAGMLTRELTDEEKESLSNKGITRKSDVNTLKLFGEDFMSAAEYIGAFNR